LYEIAKNRQNDKICGQHNADKGYFSFPT